MKLTDKVRVAAEFAGMLFRDQGKMYGAQPYERHLQDVHDVLLRFDVTDRDMLAAAFLHDILEDTETDIWILDKVFGANVSELVWLVTDEPGVNRMERKEKTYPKIRQSIKGTQLKLADRIANLENSIATKDQRMFRMYRKEHPEFVLALRQIGQLDNMWDHLSGLITRGEEVLVYNRELFDAPVR